MKWKIVILICVLMVRVHSTDIENEEGLDLSMQYDIPRKGVQDFSEGEIFMVEKSVKVSIDGEYVSVSGSNYECLIKKELSEDFLTFQKEDALIVYGFPGSQPFGQVNAVEGVLKEGTSEGRCVSKFVYRNVSEGMDIQYSFLHHKVLEEVILHKFRNIEIVEEFSIQNVWLSEKEGSIYFYHVKTGRLAFFIPKPVMYEEGDYTIRCFGIYYEIEKIRNSYVIRKVIDKEGLAWLMDTERVYPVIIDSTTEGGIQDPWEESGLLPYGQYFQNLNEYVNPCNGSLTVTQTDLHLPGRGMDLIISRVYTTPQLFGIDDKFTPTEEDPPWKIANGWRYDLPGITENYLYLWGGRMYNLEWGTDPPECSFWCFPPLEPGEEVFNNHKGDHFRLIKHVDGSYTLYLKDGRICLFSSSGDIQVITDVYGNEITFSGNVITDTMGRVVSLSPTGISFGQYSVNYTIQYVDYTPLLTAVTDCVGRVTHYYYEHANKFLLTKVVYPTQGYTEYVYGMKERRICNEDPCHVWNEDCHEVPDCYQSLYQFRVTVQRVYADTLVKVRAFTYVEDWENTLESTEKTKDDLSYVQSETHFVIENGKIKKRTVKDYTGTQIEKVVYTYNAQGETVINQYYKGNTSEVTYQEFSQYDEWGNQIYTRNSLGYEMFASYVNTSSEGKFTDYSGNSFEFSNQFYTNNVTGMYNKVAGVSMITGGASVETYYQYDSSGNMVETRDIYNGKSYQVYYGLFDENGQVSFPFTADTPINDLILRIASLPTLNSVLQSETHTASDHPWYDNTGYWQNQYYNAHWVHAVGGEVEEGYDPVGPFIHYPGTSGYIDYETWVSELTQYVKTNYTIYENVSPLPCSYNLNSGSWVEITSELGNGTAQTTVPSELILQENTIQFQESSIYSTRFQWMLLIPVQDEPETHYKDFEYDLYGNLISASNCYGTISFEYSTEYESAYLTAVTDPVGNTISCAYDNSGNIVSITDARGYTSAYEYDLLNRLTKKINPDLTEKEAVYDDINNEVTIYDELDHAVTKYFDGLGRITEIVYGPYTEEYTYNYLGKIETRTDPLQLVYTYEYDSIGRILKAYNPDGTYTSTVYNDLQNTVEIYDENLSKTEYAYDWNGNLTSVKEYIDQNFYLTEYTYNESGNIARMKNAKGNTTLYKYGMFGLTSIIYPDATEEHFNYDCIGNVIEKIQGTRTIQYHYNAASQLMEVEYPDSFVTFTYDPNGNRTSMVDTVSSVISIYDSRNRLISETKTIDDIDYTTSYLYDAASNLVSITYPDGTTIEQEYDSLNRIMAVNQYAQFLWNGNSQPEQITYQNGVTTDYVYDLRSRPLKIRTTKNDSDLLHLTYSYDCAGNILQMKNSEENGTQTIKEQWDYTYDNLNRLLTAVGDPGDGYSLHYEYDSVGNRIEMNNTLYTYNNMNELLSIDSELGSPGSTPWWDSSYTYRREITFGQNHDVIPEGYTCTFTMDTTESLQSGDDIRIVYQTDTQALELDRIGDTWNTPTTKISFKIQSEIPANTERGTGTYYVYYGNPQAGPPPANPSLIYIFYDDFNRANSLIVGNSWIEDEQNLGIGILRILESQLRIEEHQNEYAHIEHALSEDNIEISCRIKPDANGGSSWAPSLDIFWNDTNNGNHVQILTTGDGKLGCKVVSNGIVESQSFSVVTVNQYNWVRIRLTFDTIYFDYGGTGTTPVWVNNLTKSRPTSLSGSPSKIILGKGVEQVSYTNFDLDNNYATPGNLGVQFIDDLITRKYLVNPPELSLGVEETEELGGEEEIHYNFTYDDYGNCITKSDGINTWEYAYDYENRLLSITENGQITEQYIYNGDGQRIKKINADSTRVYIYSGINVLYEINMTTQMDAIYIYGPTGRIAKKVNDITEFYHTDHLGSTRLTTSETGAPVTEVQYKPFGEQINTTEERYTYNGKELDSTGLYYYGARYYDPEIGRFISRDPLQGDKAVPQTLNKYMYCLNNPLKYIDPTGTNAEETVEEIFQRLLAISPEEYQELEEEYGEINLEALVEILKLLGYEVYNVDIANKSFKVTIDDESSITVVIDDTMSEYGEFNIVEQTAYINLSKCGTITDLAMVALHEISHAVLSRSGGPNIDEQEAIIYNTQYLYKNVLLWGGVNLSDKYAKHIDFQANFYDPHGVIHAPISNVLVKWMQTQGWKRCRE